MFGRPGLLFPVPLKDSNSSKKSGLRLMLVSWVVPPIEKDLPMFLVSLVFSVFLFPSNAPLADFSGCSPSLLLLLWLLLLDRF